MTLRSLLARLGCGAIGLTLALPAVTANAAFPGQNGPLLTINATAFLFEPSSLTRTPLTPASLFRPALPAAICNSPAGGEASPDGQLIVLCEADPLGGPGRIAVMNADGSDRHLIGSSSDIYENPGFAADGQHVLSMRTSMGGSGSPTFRDYPNIWSMRIDGSDPVALKRDTTALNFGPRASADGDHIAFISYRDGGNHLDVMDADGAHRHQLVSGDVTGRALSWSPDGLRVAYTRPGDEVWVVNADGTDDHRVAAGSAPVWSPDGTRLAFMSAAGIVSVTPDGGDLQVLDPSPPAALNDWLPQPWGLGPYRDVVLADAPLAYWRLGDAADQGARMSDETGANPGSYKNGVKDGGVGISGDADHVGSFVGNGTYGFVNGLAAPRASYTLEAWVKVTDTDDAVIVQHGGAGALAVLGGRFAFRQVNVDLRAPDRVQAGHWYHVVGTWDGATARLFVNGVAVATAPSTKAPSGAATLYLGYGDLAPWLRGSLDEVAYYPTALSAQRIADHYHADPPALRETPRRRHARTRDAR